MHALYAFLTGTALRLAFIVFFGGLILRVIYLYGLSRERDRVFYNHLNLRWAFRSIVHWVIPWASASMRSQPIFTLAFFVFHLCLFAVPLFLTAHNMLWREALGLGLLSMPDRAADGLTMAFMTTGVFLFLRRIIRPEVRILTTLWDYTLLVLTLAPFITGFLAYHQWGPYQIMSIAHILSAEILLVLIPFTKLGHVVLFFFSRAVIGVEMGRRQARSW